MFVYKIANKVNGKIYIGITSNTVKERFQQHKARRSERNTALANAMVKYGVENFEVETIDTAKNYKELLEKEIYYIEYYDSYNTGYNLTLGGEGNKQIPFSDQEIIVKYHELKSSDKTGKFFNIASNSVLRVLHKNGVELYGSGWEATERVDSNEIAKEYAELRAISLVAEKLGIAPMTVKTHLEKLGTDFVEFGFTTEEEKELVDYYKKSNKSISQISREKGIKSDSISRILKKHNVKIDPNRNRITSIILTKDGKEYFFESVTACANFIIEQDWTKSKKVSTVTEGINRSIRVGNVPYYGMTFVKPKI